jgi:hypothetical protein
MGVERASELGKPRAANRVVRKMLRCVLVAEILRQ